MCMSLLDWQCLGLAAFAGLPLLACLVYLGRMLMRSCRVAGPPCACDGSDPGPNAWHFGRPLAGDGLDHLRPHYFDVRMPAGGPGDVP
jgi:hypothetical protein